MSTDRTKVLKAITEDDLNIGEISDVTGVPTGKVEMILQDLKRAKQAAVAADGSWRGFK